VKQSGDVRNSLALQNSVAAKISNKRSAIVDQRYQPHLRISCLRGARAFPPKNKRREHEPAEKLRLFIFADGRNLPLPQCLHVQNRRAEWGGKKKAPG
jgi:hypothetical protein